MRREAPNPFGTSLVDLLVSGLAMVAMLWVMNSTNSGFLGTGEEETTSGMVLIEQFGNATHMESVTLRLQGQWSCTYELVWNGSSSVAHNGVCDADPGATPPSSDDLQDGRLTFAAPTAPPEIETTVLIRLDHPVSDDPLNRFFTSLRITVENLAGQNLIAEVGIEPCCSQHQPHYVRISTFSGAGPDEVVTFWHEASLFSEVLEVPDPEPDGSYNDPAPLRTRPWILNLRDDIAVGNLNPRRTIFDPPSGQDCGDMQSGDPPNAILVFETEGDIAVSLPASSGSSSEYLALLSDFDERIANYLSYLDAVRP